MNQDSLGKGEVESSILSHSTSKPTENKENDVCADPAHCADSRVNDSGTVAKNWQSLFSAIDQRDREYQLHRNDIEPTYLYRYFDDLGGLLYVGITNCPWQRHEAHGCKPWFRYAWTMCLERFPYRRFAEAAEYNAIKDEKPEFNRNLVFAGGMFPPHMRWYLKQTDGRIVGQERVWGKVEAFPRVALSTAPDWWSEPAAAP